MPTIHQPQSLVSLVRQIVVSEIMTAVHMASDAGILMLSAEMVSMWRNMFQEQCGGGSLPATLRDQLLLDCTNILNSGPRTGQSCLGVMGRFALLLSAMLDRDISKLHVRLCCSGQCVHKDLVLEMIARYAGPGLTTLELSHHDTLRLDIGLCQSIFSSADNLTTLILQNNATDRTLKVIGRFCFNLTVLDVSLSQSVSDKGICNLLYTSSGALNRLNNFNDSSCDMEFVRAIEGIDWPVVAQRVLPCMGTTQLCRTLCVLDLVNTNVSRIGIVIALLSASRLRSLGEWCHVGQTLRLLNECSMSLGDGLQLAVATSPRANRTQLRAIVATCPRLSWLTIMKPLFKPAGIPGALTRLHLKRVPKRHVWLNGLLNYLRGPRSQHLQRLSLDFHDVLDFQQEHDENYEEAPVTFDVAAFVYNILGLETLKLKGIDVTFTVERGQQRRLHDGLRQVDVGTIDSSLTMAQLVQCAPGLKALRVNKCLGMRGEALVQALSGAPQLRCIRLSRVESIDVLTIYQLAINCPAIAHIGDLSKLGFNRRHTNNIETWMADNNYDVLLLGTNHRRHCTCFV